jgi:hypothetical protein
MDTLPDKNENYKDVEYWNDRYATEESYEWCKDYASVRELFNSNIKRDMKILVIGKSNILCFVRETLGASQWNGKAYLHSYELWISSLKLHKRSLA